MKKGDLSRGCRNPAFLEPYRGGSQEILSYTAHTTVLLASIPRDPARPDATHFIEANQGRYRPTLLDP
jgi:hypothetical protein